MTTQATTAAYQFNRQAYMANECTHEEYNAQFVTKSVLLAVKNGIGLKRIQASTDQYLNDIPLSLWDRLTWADDSRMMVAESNASMYAPNKQHVGAVSASDKVSVMKQAAKMLKANPALT